MSSRVMLVLTLLVSQSSNAAVADLGWMAGCWKMTTGTRAVTEYWLPPHGGTMIGVSRTISGGRTVEYEFLLLRVGQKGVEYVAKPSGQPEAVFTSTKVSATEAVFENPAHDFPTRITYRKAESGIVASIDGTVKGKARTIEFRYQAADCSAVDGGEPADRRLPSR